MMRAPRQPQALLLGLFACSLAQAARAQAPAPQPEASTPPAAADSPATPDPVPAPGPAPAAEPAAPAPSPNPNPYIAPAPSPAPSATPAPASPPATSSPAPATRVQPDPTSLWLAEQRWRARAKAQRAAAAERDDQRGPRVYGNAGAPFAVGVGLTTPFHADSSFDAFDDDDVGLRLGAWLAYDIVSFSSASILALELDYGAEHEASDSLRGGALDTELDTHALSLGVQLRFVPVSVFQPHLRLAGGAAFAQMELDAGAERFEDEGFAPFGSLGLGFTLRTPTRLFENSRGQLASLALGLMFEGGYSLSAPLAFALEDDAGDGAIAVNAAELGELQRSGAYLRVSALARF